MQKQERTKNLTVSSNHWISGARHGPVKTVGPPQSDVRENSISQIIDVTFSIFGEGKRGGGAMFGWSKSSVCVVGLRAGVFGWLRMHAETHRRALYRAPRVTTSFAHP